MIISLVEGKELQDSGIGWILALVEGKEQWSRVNKDPRRTCPDCR